MNIKRVDFSTARKGVLGDLSQTEKTRIDIDREVFTTEEAADFLRVDRITIYRWIKKRGLPCTKIGKLFRFRRQDLHDWLTKHQLEK